MMNGRTPTQDVEGTVEAVNANGLKIGGAWLNVSQFGPKLELPDAGAHVRLSVDSRGYIKQLQVLDGGRLPLDGGASSLRDATIRRLAVLKAAAAFGAARADCKSADVLRIADAWLAWVEQA